MPAVVAFNPTTFSTHMSNLDPRIGMLGSGRYYAFVNGHGAPETIGTLPEIEAALGIRREEVAMQSQVNSKPRPARKTWTVTMSFQYPAWDEVEGILYRGIEADSKSEANRQARSMAERDGHLCGGKGRVVFTASVE